MPKGLLARKLGTTELFTEQGTVMAVTVLECDQCFVTQRKDVAVDGYSAVQIGYDVLKAKHVNKPMAGHFKVGGVEPLRTLTEIRDASGAPDVGTKLSVNVFRAGERVDVTGTTQGKGWTGYQKRHNFRRGPVSHGSKNVRQPGSIGSVDAARVFKGMKMAGHHGASRATVRNLEVVRVDGDRNLLLVRGSVPGPKNATVLIRSHNRAEAFA